MALQSTAIRRALEELLDGTIGSIRTVAATTLSMGHLPWDGQLLSNSRFDVRFINMESHSATPVQAIGSHRIEKLTVQVDVYHAFKSSIQESERGIVRSGVLRDLDACKQALQMPNNLNVDASGNSTCIISGMLVNIVPTIVAEDWEADPPRTHSQITADALVRVTQATS